MWLKLLPTKSKTKGKFKVKDVIRFFFVTGSVLLFVMDFAQMLVMEIGSWLLDLSHIAVSVVSALPRYTTTLS